VHIDLTVSLKNAELATAGVCDYRHDFLEKGPAHKLQSPTESFRLLKCQELEIVQYFMEVIGDWLIASSAIQRH
jgi:hypothetical protein